MSIKLSEMPITTEFLKRLYSKYKKLGSCPNFEKDFELIGRCECGEEGCATFYIKGKHEFNEERLGFELMNTDKGLFIIRFEEGAEIEIEALDYISFPYKYELERVLNGKIQKASKEELHMVDEYFKNIKNESLVVHSGSLEES